MDRAEKAKASSVEYVVQCELVHFYKARENKKNVTPGLVWKCQEVELRRSRTSRTRDSNSTDKLGVDDVFFRLFILSRKYPKIDGNDEKLSIIFAI